MDIKLPLVEKVFMAALKEKDSLWHTMWPFVCCMALSQGKLKKSGRSRAFYHCNLEHTRRCLCIPKKAVDVKETGLTFQSQLTLSDKKFGGFNNLSLHSTITHKLHTVTFFSRILAATLKISFAGGF